MPLAGKHFGKWAWILPVILLAFPVKFYIFSLFDHNEHMYVAAAEGLANGKTMYRDFAFLQMPLQPWIILLIKALTGTSDWLFAGKLTGLIAWIGLTAGLIFMATNGKPGLIPAALISLGTALNPTLLRSAMESSNYAIPAFFCLLAFLCLHFQEKKWNPFLAGLFLGLAASGKLFYVVFIPVLFFPIRKKILVSAGLLAGLALPIIYLIRFPEAFMFQNLEFHYLTSEWRKSLNSGTGFSFQEKKGFFLNWLKNPIQAAWVGSAVLMSIWELRKNRRFWLNPGLWVFLLSIPLALYPAPLFEQYLLLVWLGAALLLCSLPEFSVLAWVLVAAFSIFTDPAGILKTPIRNSYIHDYHEVSQNIRKHINNPDAIAAGYSTIYAMNAGLQIPDVFRTGAFLSRLDTLIPAHPLWVRLSELEQWLEENQPDVIIAGEEFGYDAPFYRFAERNQYQLLSNTGHLSVFIHPE